MKAIPRRTAGALTLIGSLLITPALVAGPAVAKDGDVFATGTCTGSSELKLKAGPEDGMIEVEAEVDSNVRRQVWSWALTQVGRSSRTDWATTTGASGSFEVEVLFPDEAGADTFTFIASFGGETCRGTVTFPAP
ncbi:MAG: hypothetical protein ACLGH4_01045 [Actinomycetes bacterium]